MEGSGEIEIEYLPDDDPEATETYNEDGSVTVDLDPEAEAPVDTEFSSNLAEDMSDADLSKVGAELVKAFDDDDQSRDPWKKAYIKGVTLMGLKIEERTQPWAGASGVFHPILTEAVVRFQADAMTETFPAAGPVLTKVVGKDTPEKTKQAKRVGHDMNYQCTEVMTEYRTEHELALFHLPIAGSAFKKVYFDYNLGRPTARFIPADDFVVAYGTADLETCPRMTHVLKKFPNEIKKAMRDGQYITKELGHPVQTLTDVEKKRKKVEGIEPDVEKDDRHTLLEMHVEYDLPGHEAEDGIGVPYIITIEKHDRKILSIYRNWREDDELKAKSSYFIHYPYLPGFGFYGIGLVHLLGGIAKSATSILRQLVDAGTLANLPAGLKSRGLRIKGDDSPLRPGEFRDVDVPGGAIKDNITFLPYKEPSTVLFQLLGSIVEEGRTIASIADIKISDMNQQSPVGTTLAIIERGMKVMSGVHARIHAAMRKEFKLLAKLVKEHAPPEYEYDVESGATRAQDYDDRIDVLPVSNPNASTMAQRIMQGQAVLQLAQTAPQIYDQKKLHRQMVDAMGLPNADEIIPLEDEMKPMDPVAENMAIFTGEPIKAHDHQDHEAHIRVHMAAASDPKLQEIIKQSPQAQAIAGAGEAHIREHVAFQYRREIEKQLGMPLPKYGEFMPPEAEVDLSKLVADAADKLLKKDQAEAQMMKQAQQAQDPIIQLQKMEAETKRLEVQRKGMADKLRAMATKAQIDSKEKMAGMEIGVEMRQTLIENALAQAELDIKREGIQSREKVSGAQLGVQVADNLLDAETERLRIQAQEGMEDTRQAGAMTGEMIRSETALEQEGIRAETADKQTAAQLAWKFMDLLRGREQTKQQQPKKE
jgi:hypothetical protein